VYTEIVKIIEGGLNSDREKVINYATVLADNLEAEGESSLAKKIRSVLNQKKGKLASLDSFSTKPVDTESRLDMIEVTLPKADRDRMILNKHSQDAIDGFIESYRHRDTLMRSGLEIPNSLLLYGPPGCGKTTAAQYISGVMGLPLLTARLDGLVSSLLGSTAKNIRKIFDHASKGECILFLDEFDVIAKLRDDKNELGELKRVVNSLMQNIDTFSKDSMLIAATNHHELLDPAIWRRFSTVITLEKPRKEEIGRLVRNIFDGKRTNFMNNPKKLKYIEGALSELSHSDIKTIASCAMRNMVIGGKDILTDCEMLKEIYLHRNHGIKEESDLIKYLLLNGATHRSINEDMGIPLRKVRNISKDTERGR
jgi:SpoVK/Ycf46/Vps4 family AAA+-type ATPase